MQSNTQNKWLGLFLGALTTFIITLSAPAFAKGDVFVNNNGIAIKGYDTVAYFVNSAPQKGKQQFSHVHAGNTWLFANAANKKAFIANPAAYMPQYGGHCAFAASKNSIAPVDPKAWTIRDGKLFLNYSLTVRETWLPNVAKNIVKANQNWPALAKKVKTR